MRMGKSGKEKWSGGKGREGKGILTKHILNFPQWFSYRMETLFKTFIQNIDFDDF